MNAFTRRAIFAAPLVAAFAAYAEDAATNTLTLTTKYGKTVIRLRPDLAPKHVAQIKKLVKRKFYDGIVFHRVIPGFMAQTGDRRQEGRPAPEPAAPTCPTFPTNSRPRTSPAAR